MERGSKQRNSELTQAPPGRTWYFAAVLSVAFILAGLILYLGVPFLQQTSVRSYSVGFVDGYDQIANNLANGSGYRWGANMSETMLREPGYPLLLAMVFKVAGYSIEAVQVLNWILMIGIALMVMQLGVLVTGDRVTALIASLLFVFHPGTLIAEARGGVEIFFIFVSAVFLLFLYQALRTGKGVSYLIAGCSLGAVIQVRSTPLALPLLLLAYLLIVSKSSGERIRATRNVGLVVCGMAIVLVPWVIRNYRLVHAFVPATSLKGVAMQEGQYTCEHFSFGGDFYVAGKGAGLERGGLAKDRGFRYEGAQYFQLFYDAHDELAFSNMLFKRASQEYLKRPGLLAKCMTKNLFNFWFLGKTWNITELNIVIQAPLLILAIGGLIQLWKRNRIHKASGMLLFAVSVFVVHMPMVAEARYSIPIIAFLTIPAGMALMAVWKWSSGVHI